MHTDKTKIEHEEMIEEMAKLHARVKRAGLVRTTRAMQDALRLIHWESAIVFDAGFVPKRKEDMGSNVYDTKVTVLTVDDEVSAI